MTIEEAITKAVEGGWIRKDYLVLNIPSLTREFPVECILLDPLFWQALGKAIGWNTAVLAFEDSEPTWKDHQHRLISHIQSGKSIESFFETL